MRIGVAADHGGFELKEYLIPLLEKSGHEVTDFGAYENNSEDDYPDFVGPLAKAAAKGEFDRGLAICGRGVGASVAANKTAGVRAALVSDVFSAHQGVEDDNMNIICPGGRVTGKELAWDLTAAFLNADFRNEERFVRRLNKVESMEKQFTKER